MSDTSLPECGICKLPQYACTCGDNDAYDENADSRCDNCGGEMEWCTSCRMWSKTCCDDYGTCMCS